MDVEQRQIRADHRHHRVDGPVLDDGERLRLRMSSSRLPNSAASAWPRGPGSRRDRGRRNLADRLAERFPVAQHRRATENVDLRTGIVDDVFLHDIVAGKGQDVGGRVADHGAAQWPTCIGPVGLADTYSTLTLTPLPMPDRP